MAFELGNLVVETTSTELTGDLELNGAVTNRARFRDGLADGAETFYFVTDGSQREWGIGTLAYGAPDTLSRDTVLGNSAGTTAKISWGSGTKSVVLSPPAELFTGLMGNAKGGSAPGWALDGTLWLDTSLTGLAVVKAYDGSGWAELFAFIPGLKTDGTDMASVLATAAANAGGREIRLPAGTVTVSSEPDWSGCDQCHFVGQKPERGVGFVTNNATIIDCPGMSAGEWFFSRFEASNPTQALGPFVFENLRLDLGVAHGFEFGRGDLAAGSLDFDDYDAITDGAGQRYIMGVKLRGVHVRGTAVSHASDANGVITRSGQRGVMFVKAFESEVVDCAFFGCDVQIEIYGCDTVTVDKTRGWGCHVGILMNKSGSFAVENRITNYQNEGATFGGVVADGVMLSAGNLRIEQNISQATAGMGRYDLTAEQGLTAAVTAGSRVIPMSADVTGILFPYLSLIELSDAAGNTDTCLVTKVDGTDVTVWPEHPDGLDDWFQFDWSDVSANVTRIHGYGFMHGGTHGCEIHGGHVDAFLNCPTFVAHPTSGSMVIGNILKNVGINPGVGSIILNNMGVAAPNLSKGMVFYGCSTTVLADPTHPMVTVLDHGGTKGAAVHTNAYRYPHHGALDQIHGIPGRRIWHFTPQDYTTSFNEFDHYLWKKVTDIDGEADGGFWAWKIPADASVNARFGLPTILSEAVRSNVRWAIAIRTQDGAAGSFDWQYVGNGGSTLVQVDIPAGNGVFVYEHVEDGVPAQWQGTRATEPVGLYIRPDDPVYIFGVWIIEEPKLIQKSDYSWETSGLKIVTRDVATAFVRMTNEYTQQGTAAYELTLKASPRGSLSHYAQVVGRWRVVFTMWGGSPTILEGPTEIWKQASSVNSGVAAVDVAVTTGASGEQAWILAEVSFTGSQEGTIAEGLVYWKLEALGDNTALVEHL